MKVSSLLREAASNYWWDIGKGKAEPRSTSSVLGDLVKSLGPAILGGLAGWHASQRKLSVTRSQSKPETTEPLYIVISKLLKADRVDYAFETRKRSFELPKGAIKLTNEGIILQGPGFTWKEKGQNPVPVIKRFLAKIKNA